MNKIETLIKELCPNGVEWKDLGELCKIETGKLNANEAMEGGKFPFFTTAKEISWINTYRWDAEALLIAGNANVGDIKYYSGKFEAYQRTYVLTEFSERIHVKYLYHYIRYDLKRYLELNTKKGAMSYIVLSTLKEFIIPIPPLEIQEEIVKILDKFTDYVTELTTELTLRQKQYHYYQDELFTFENEEVEWKRFDEVCEIIRGNGLQKKDFVSEGVPCIHYGQIYTYYGITANETKSFVSNTVSEKLKKASYGDIILATTSENIEDVGKSLVWLGEEEVCIGGHSCILKTNQNSEYINHYLRTTQFQKQKERLVIGTKVIELYPKKIGTILIPIPSPETQLRISEILNGFNNLCNSFGEGLPKEIELRQKQYEFYRDKLLSFD